MSLTIDKIVQKLVEENNIKKREARDFVDSFFDELRHIITNGKANTRLAKIVSFGTFEKVAGNKTTIKFHPTPDLQARVQRPWEDDD